MTSTACPHAAHSNGSPLEDFVCALFDRLWANYRHRVPYVQTYELLISTHDATFFNDHIAFRSVAGPGAQQGAASLARLFVALGYRAAGNYHFEDKHLDAVHYQHANARFPKLFLSELRSWELPADVRTLLAHRATAPATDLDCLAALANLNQSASDSDALLDQVVKMFDTPNSTQPPIEEKDLLRVAEVSQYAAWVLLHGSSVNHFTSLINSHGVAALDSIDKTVAALREQGVPMKEEVEGDPGSCLRQSATAAVDVTVPVLRNGEVVEREWTYAYFELAERGDIQGADGQPTRFEGFLGPQATHLFEMTRRNPMT